MRRKLIAALSLLLCVVMLSGCLGVTIGSMGSGVRGEGPMVVFPVATGEFTAVNVGGAFEISYRQADTSSVTLEIQENLFELIEFNVIDGVLNIDSTGSFTIDWGNSPRLTIYAPTLEQLTLTGAVSTGEWDIITAESFLLDLSGAASATIPMAVNSLTLDISGAGSLSLNGTADVADIQSTGAASIDAGRLQTRIATVAVSGAGSVTIATSEQLSASISGAGSLHYIGNPTVSQSVSGAGSIDQIG
ncbi:MAG: DUF2807 domain-containing protein [Oscillospiraceae bacterium]|nr:DUF2807 domain-containing protein [Oscillospiraceae bacterium]